MITSGTVSWTRAVFSFRWTEYPGIKSDGRRVWVRSRIHPVLSFFVLFFVKAVDPAEPVPDSGKWEEVFRL